MRNRFSLAVVSLGALALAACGGGSDDPATPAETTEAGDTMADPADTGVAVEGDAASAPGVEGEDDATITPGEPVVPPVPPAVPAPVASPTTPPPGAASAWMDPPASFATCAICHAVEAGRNGIGPHLAGVVGRAAGSVPGFSYSPAMAGTNLRWTEDNLVRYLDNPAAVVPGGSMPDPNVDTAQARAIVEYLKSL